MSGIIKKFIQSICYDMNIIKSATYTLKRLEVIDIEGQLFTKNKLALNIFKHIPEIIIQQEIFLLRIVRNLYDFYSSSMIGSNFLGYLIIQTCVRLNLYGVGLLIDWLNTILQQLIAKKPVFLGNFLEIHLNTVQFDVLEFKCFF